MGHSPTIVPPPPLRPEPIRLFLVHAQPLLTEAVSRAFVTCAEVRLVGADHDLVTATAKLDALEVDLVLVDVSVGERRACEWMLAMRDSDPEIHLVPMGLCAESQAVAFIEAGASGYVLRSSSLADLVRTIEAVHRGEPPCSPRIAASICARIAELSLRRHAHAIAADLTPREGQVLELVARGLRNKEIAQRLEITVPTVKNHVHNILEKLNVGGRREAILRAYESGILTRPLR